MPTNVTACNILDPNGRCTRIYLSWEPPSGTIVSHYVIIIDGQEHEISKDPLSGNIEHCNPRDVSIKAVDKCGRSSVEIPFDIDPMVNCKNHQTKGNKTPAMIRAITVFMLIKHKI